MASGVKRTGKNAGTAKVVPARLHVQTPAEDSERSTVEAADAARKAAKTSGRTLPIRSSPVGTAPSLRSKLSTLKTLAKPAARAQAPAGAKPKKPPFARNPVIQELEPRLLMSADLNPLSGDALLSSPALAGAEFRSITDTGTPAVVTSAAVAPIQRTNELVFVDTATPDYQKLVDSMRESALAQGRNLEFVLIDAERDGIRKITDTLARKSDLDAIHIISHAQDGSVQLGSSKLDFETLLKRAAAVKKWGSALTENGDILFYGCDLAATEKGKSLMEAMSRLTGADVAASEDLTGAAARGGDWDLEFRTGAIEADLLVSADVDDVWDGVLATFTVINTNDAGVGSLRQAILDATNAANPGTDTIAFNIGAVGSTQNITLASALPNITANGAIIIDGWTQGGAGYQGAPLIGINGNNLNVDGLRIDVGNSTVRGLAIYNFRGDGIDLRTGDNNVIAGNYIGVTPAGVASGTGLGSNYGISISTGSDSNTIGGTTNAERNVISANGNVGSNGGGISIDTLNNVVRGNYIGINPGGTAAMGNHDGIILASNSLNTSVLNNVISGNASDGIEVNNSDNNIFQGNYIGTNPAGAVTAWSANADDGIDLGDPGGGDGSDNNTIGGTGAGQGNIIAGNASNGIEVDPLSTNNVIRANSIFSNTTLGIDLDENDAVNANDAAPDNDAGGNNLQNFPVITNAYVSGGFVTITGTLASRINSTYALDFFANPAAAAGREGRTYLGSVSVVTDGAGNATFTAAFSYAGYVTADRLTATATCLSSPTAGEAGNTSEFGASFVTTAPPGGTRTISGTVYEDVDGDANIIEAGTQLVAGATVRIYRDVDGSNTINAADNALVATVTTDALGVYSLSGLAAGRYWVAVDSKTINPSNVYNAGSGLGNVWAEQTYAVDGATAVGFTGGAGTLFGGRNEALSDNAAALLTSEHVVRADATGGNVAGRNFGFSFQVVTNTLAGDNADHDGSNPRTVQGSLRQFIDNANAIAGAATMRFVPAVAPDVVNGVFSDDGNYANDGGDDWWRITVTTALPVITTLTTIDGTAYSRFDGTTVINTNAAVLGYVGAVGLGADGIAGTGDDPAPLAGVQAPELEIVEGGAAQIAQGLDIQANNVTVRRISIHGFGADDTGASGNLFSEADIRIGQNLGGDVGLNFTGTLIEDNVIGFGPGGIADPGFMNRSVSGVASFGADGGTLRGNLIGYAGRFGAFLSNNSDGWTIQANDFRDNAIENTQQDSLDLGNLSGGATVSRNYFFHSHGGGVDGYRSDGGNIIENNTFEQNGGGPPVSEPAQIRLYGTGSTVRYNLIQNGFGPGILVVQDDGTTNTPSIQNLITRNSFSNNAGISIDLNGASGNNSLGDGIGFSGGTVGAGNTGIASPVITAASLAGTSLTVSGTAPANATIEIYRAVPGADTASLIDDWSGATAYGEGVQFLGTATANGAGNWTNTFDVTGLLSAGQFVSAIAISGTNNTSEFGANFTVVSAGNISGTIFNDVNADSTVTVPEGVFSGVTVRLYQDNGNDIPDAADGAAVQTVATNASGVYTFTGVGTGTYWVVVDSRTITLAAGSLVSGAAGQNDIWADQTYASANATALGTGGAIRAVSYDGALHQFDSTSGAFYGGLIGGRTDDGSTLNAAAAQGAEHIQRVRLSGANVAGVDSGYSFNVVTNTRGDTTDFDAAAGALRVQQGSLRQFILNANEINGANAMRFVPAVNTNDAGSGGTWWTINVAAALPTISGANTTIDGTAYSSADGVTIVNPNAGQVGTGGTVGVDALALATVARPELELAGGNLFAGNGLRVTAGNVTIENLAINGFGLGLTSEQIYIDGTVTDAAGAAVITGNLVGTNADGTNPGANEVAGIFTNGAASISNNYVGYIEGNGLMMSLGWQNNPNLQHVTIVNNEIAFNQFVAGFTSDMISDVPTNGVVIGNYMHDFQGPVTVGAFQGKGIEVWYQAQNALIENNTITGMRIAGIGINDGSNNNTIRKNIITGTTGVGGSGGAGILLTSFDDPTVVNAPSTGNTITQNSIYNNFGLGIDLDARTAFTMTFVGDGVTSNDAGDPDTGGNGLQNFPVLFGAGTDGIGNVTIAGRLNSTANTTFRIEFFRNTAADAAADGNPTNGEGRYYLGSVDVTTDASGNVAYSGSFARLVAVGDVVTATATNLTTGSTSEFAANVTAVAARSIAGAVLHDADGDANVAEGEGGFAGATVKLYLDDGDGSIGAGDALVTTAATGAGGSYSFSMLAPTRYWVVVDSKTLAAPAYNGGFGINDVWAEETYAVFGAATGATVTGVSGAFYGGRFLNTSDNAAALTTAEHVIGRDLVAVNATNVDYGFSFNAVTNTRGDGADHDLANARKSQGSLEQFILNANAIQSSIANQNVMRFVPGAAPNVVTGAYSDDGVLNDGGDDWWRITLTAALPAITDQWTVLDATAYSRFDGSTPLVNTNAGVLGNPGMQVGLGADATAGTGDDPTLPGVPRPELELVDGANVDWGLKVGASNVTIRYFSIRGFGDDPNTEADIVIGDAVAPQNYTAIVVEDNVIGSGPASFADPGAGNRSISGIAVFGPDSGFIRRNLIGFTEHWGVILGGVAAPDADGWTIQSNEIRSTAMVGLPHDGLDLAYGASGTTVTGNLFVANRGTGVDMYQSGGGNLIENNTVTGNGTGGNETAGIRVFGPGNTVQLNRIENNAGAGVLVVGQDGGPGAPSTGNLISRNSFSGNGANAIDLVAGPVLPAVNKIGDGITLNDGGTSAAAGNTGLDHPVITSATLVGLNTTIAGTAPANATIEVYRALAAAGDSSGGNFYGEGVQYLGTAVADGAGNWSITVTGLVLGNAVSAIAIDGSNNTSEFGRNATVVAATGSIAGTIFHDVDGDADVSLADGTLTFAGATVRLFLDDGDGVIDAGDTLQATAITNGAGQYAFASLVSGTYWVTVDSTTLTSGAAFNLGYDASWIWAEQTYGDDATTAPLVLGARYGGLNAGTSDAAGAASPVGSEHVSRVAVAGAAVTGVDSGYSFNAVVNTTDDPAGVPGNRTVQGSLRQFVQNANAITNASFGIQTSNFSIGGGGVQSIAIATVLPIVTDAVVLDGTTQEGYGATPLVELDGFLTPGAPAFSMGIEFGATAGGSTVRGLMINGFGSDGILINAGANGNLIENNYIGTDATGTLDRGNRDDGIDVNSRNNVIRNNVVSGNLDDGIVINGATTSGNVVTGNRIGTNAAGTGAAGTGNGSYGVQIRLGANGNTIGGTTVATRNIISGNSLEGVYLRSDAGAGNVVIGNYIGTDVNGTAALGNGPSGVRVEAASSTIGGAAAGAGNLISGNAGTGITLSGGGASTVAGNYVGTNAAGNAALGNGTHGIVISNSPNNTIGGSTAAERNVVSGNAQYGIQIVSNLSTGNVIQGNYVGLNAAGTGAVANSFGVLINGASSNTIGGTTAGERNVISGNSFEGVTLTGIATGNSIQGNYIGTNSAGNAPLGNTNYGVLLTAGANGNTIGGAAAGAGNLISGNTGTGLDIQSNSNVVLGNRIGTDAAGSADVGNTGPGIRLRGATNTVGGAALGEGNVVSGNAGGVYMQGAGATGNVVQGNLIGVAGDGTTPLANDFQGVIVDTGASNNLIGGTGAGQGNVIANSLGSSGITLTNTAGTGNSILRNSIYANNGRGINLQGGTEDGFGVTANDAGDGDVGANRLQNYPVLATAVSTSTQVTIVGSLDSTTGATFRLEFFANTAADPSGHGEGQRYLGFVNVTDGGAGDLDGLANGIISFRATVVAAVAPGESLSATATNTATNDTSEFAANVAIVAAQVTIAANDPAAGEPANNGQFTVSLSAPSATNTVVSYTVGGTATAGADYTALTGSVTILAGQLSALIDVTVLNDVVVEGNETVTVTLNSITSGDPQISIGAANTDTVTIADDGDTAQVSIVANDAAAGEPANNGQFTVSLSAPSSTNTVISYTVGGSATAGADYTALTGSVTILAGQLSALIDVTVLNDVVVEGNETVTVTLSSITSGDPDISINGAASSDTVTIADDGDTAQVSIVANDAAAGEPANNGQFTVSLSAVSSTNTVISYTVGGSATAGADYTALSGSVTILAGQLSALIDVTVLNDVVVEGNETVTVTLNSITSGDPQISIGAANYRHRHHRRRRRHGPGVASSPTTPRRASRPTTVSSRSACRRRPPPTRS